MPLTGLFLLPIQPNQSSPSAAIISSITCSQTSLDTLPPFSLDHRLLADTSSLLPNSDASLRKFQSILHLSHTPSKSYIATTPAGASSPTCITIPAASTDTYVQMLMVKFQAMWTPRQSLAIEAGSAFSMQDGSWVVRIGDVKQSARGQQTGQLRGMILEVSYCDADESNDSDTITKDDENLIRGTLEAMLEVLQIKLESSRSLFRKTSKNAILQKNGDTTAEHDFALATLYMDMFRGGRG